MKLLSPVDVTLLIESHTTTVDQLRHDPPVRIVEALMHGIILPQLPRVFSSGYQSCSRLMPVSSACFLPSSWRSALENGPFAVTRDIEFNLWCHVRHGFNIAGVFYGQYCIGLADISTKRHGYLLGEDSTILTLPLARACPCCQELHAVRRQGSRSSSQLLDT